MVDFRLSSSPPVNEEDRGEIKWSPSSSRNTGDPGPPSGDLGSWVVMTTANPWFPFPFSPVLPKGTSDLGLTGAFNGSSSSADSAMSVNRRCRRELFEEEMEAVAVWVEHAEVSAWSRSSLGQVIVISVSCGLNRSTIDWKCTVDRAMRPSQTY